MVSVFGLTNIIYFTTLQIEKRSRVRLENGFPLLGYEISFFVILRGICEDKILCQLFVRVKYGLRGDNEEKAWN